MVRMVNGSWVRIFDFMGVNGGVYSACCGFESLSFQMTSISEFVYIFSRILNHDFSIVYITVSKWKVGLNDLRPFLQEINYFNTNALKYLYHMGYG
jgi:hypothetical protein